MSSGVAPDWWEPGNHEVAPGVYRIPLTLPMDGLRAVNVYALIGDGEVALIDAGWSVPGAMEQLTRALAEIAREPADISDVYVTHIHRDHYTLAPELRRRYGTRVHLGAAEAPGIAAINALGNNVPVTSLHQLRRAGAAGLAIRMEALAAEEPWRACDWEPADHWIESGPLSIAGRRLEAVATPGHTKGHLVFHDRSAGLLFTGDHVLPAITPSIGFELGDWVMPLASYLESLELLLDRPDAQLLPAHGPAGGLVHERIRTLLAHHDDRLDRIAAAVGQASPANAVEVATIITWTRRQRAFDTLDVFNQMIAVCETLAHLDLLAIRGRIGRRSVGGVDYFHSPQRAVHPPSA